MKITVGALRQLIKESFERNDLLKRREEIVAMIQGFDNKSREEAEGSHDSMVGMLDSDREGFDEAIMFHYDNDQELAQALRDYYDAGAYRAGLLYSMSPYGKHHSGVSATVDQPQWGKGTAVPEYD